MKSPMIDREKEILQPHTPPKTKQNKNYQDI